VLGVPTEPRGLAVVTGASSGIGAQTVVALTAAGMRVHAVARRADRLDALAEATGCVAHTLDVRDTAGLDALLAPLEVDVLVNNAGLGRAMSALTDATYDDVERTISTNVNAVLHACRSVLGGMIDRRHGHIVNLGSMAGLYPLSAALYGASKGAVHRLSTNLRLELRGTGVRVTEICPGRVSSEFYDVAIDDPSDRAAAQDSGIEEITAADVADAIVYAVTAPARVNVNRIELQPTEQTYGGSQFVATRGTDG
jgi:3-hydroxy acid dehydrogenase/malonic semialdehyde reductase